ncbi:hypothetical protein L1987_74839 [Smallanthus sonchifolius]|uniref:Uncharacterized protein n=1 Tax=Smallanthus sonchifolius TaxID=185202 RepID=A0ACB9A3T7_9ASTR|nr:hypothetical protein L1987_74839 [Smallanthus sonchifolius]
MKRKERQQKFHDSLLNMLYAPPLPPPHHNQFDDQTLNFAREIVNSDSHHINTDELEEEDETNLSASSEEQGELGFQKLTRAQRKRLRKQKLKEAASRRRQIIGPQLPPGDQIDGGVSAVAEHQHPEGVRRNAAEKPESGNDLNHRGEASACVKVKHRRMSKKNTRDKSKMPPTNFSHGAANHGAQS